MFDDYEYSLDDDLVFNFKTYDHPEHGRFLTNFDPYQIDIYRKAIEQFKEKCELSKTVTLTIAEGYGWSSSKGLYFRAVDEHGNPLYTINLDPFWRIFDELRRNG